MTHSRTTLALLGAGLLGLPACQSPADQAPSADSTQPIAEAASDPTVQDAGFEIGTADPMASMVAIPMDSEGRHDTNLEYLLERYDADGNDSISKTEYTRSETAWGRLDKNSDGQINLADFESERGSDSTGRTRFIAQRMMAKYFQGLGDNPTPDEVTLEEVRGTFADYDLDHDGNLAKDEFTCAYEDLEQPLAGDELYSRMIGEIDVWDSIVQVADTDDNGLLAKAEVDEFFTSNANDDGLWKFEAPAPRGNRSVQRGSGGASAEAAEPTDGAMMGSVAPDFTLSSPDGSQTVTLSSFKGSKPVALIFGSYT